MKHTLAENIKRMRTSKNLTQTALAKKLGVNKSVISAYENQQRLPSLEILVKMSLEFGVSIEYLLGIEKNKNLIVNELSDKQIDILLNMIAMFKEENGR